MRIALDLQAVQSRIELDPAKSCALAFAQAVVREARPHDSWLVLDGRFPESYEPIRAAFSGLIPRDRIRVCELPGLLTASDLRNTWRMKAAELLRAKFVADLRPDIVHLPALFDGLEDDIVAAIEALQEGIPIAVTLYDTLLTDPNRLTDATSKQLFERRLKSLKRADLIFTFSKPLYEELIAKLGIPATRIVTISASRPATLDDLEWSKSARTALDAFELIDQEQKHRPRLVVESSRPTLAFVAPLPYEPTGIADYSARLLPILAKHYEIVCVVNKPQRLNPSISSQFEIRDVRWFEQNGWKTERILYQLGNSPAHAYMLPLLEQLPGLVVLHDFFLGHLLCWMSESGSARGTLIRELYSSHGTGALSSMKRSGLDNAVATYPCNLFAFRYSTGVLVHSHHAIELAREWYGNNATSRMRRIPFVPFAKAGVVRAEARGRLGLSKEAFVVCSFGFINPHKLYHRLLASWLDSPLESDKDCFLFLVGTDADKAYRKQLKEAIGTRSLNVRLTGYVNESQYVDYLAAADVAVQLRTKSRGETSAAIFDCLSQNKPLIVNAHGSAAELPDDVVLKLPDYFTDADLSSALVSLRNDSKLRTDLGCRARQFIELAHSTNQIAAAYRECIEDSFSHSSAARQERVLQRIARTFAPATLSRDDLAAVALSAATNDERVGPSQILVDITNITKNDLRTGIERVTRGVLMALLTDPPYGFRIEPVRAFEDGYVYARRYVSNSLGLSERELTDDKIEVRHGDIFLGVDWPADVFPSLRSWFREKQRQGMRTAFVIYDLIAISRPDFFPPELAPMMLRWLKSVAEIADGVVCISRTVADEIFEWLSEAHLRRYLPLSIGFFQLGSDLHASLPTKGLPKGSSILLQKMRSRPSFLMVGTLEPRKGHRQMLAAMEILWTQGLDVNLVIVGKKGWMMNEFAEGTLNHPEYNKRLFWLQAISDEMLDAVYGAARSLVAPSEGEGFGLPLVEAAQYGLPIIARDLPVFREVAGNHAFYFQGLEPSALANAIQRWLALGRAQPTSSGIQCLTWKESSAQLLDVVLGKQWYRTFPAFDNQEPIPAGHTPVESTTA